MSLGVCVGPMRQNALEVLSVAGEGAILQWNAEHPEDALQEGDVIIEVNGKSSDIDTMVSECLKSQQVTLIVNRYARTQAAPPHREIALGTLRQDLADPARHHRVTLSRSEGLIGLGVSRVANLPVLKIVNLSPSGAAAAWNAEHPQAQLREGDLVIEVNGKSWDVTAMLQECFEATSALDLKVKRDLPDAAVASI